MQIRLTQLLSNNNVTGSDVMVTDVSGPLGYITKQTTVDKLAKYITGSIVDLNLNSLSASTIQTTVITASIVSASTYIGLTGGGNVIDTANNNFTGVNTFATMSVAVISSSLIPSDDSVWDLGSLEKQWRDLHLSGTTIYLGGKQISVVNNSIAIDGDAIVVNTTASASVITSIKTENLQTNTISTNIFKITASYNFASDPDRHVIFVNAIGGEVTASLPLAADVPNRQYIFKKTDSGIYGVTILSPFETIDGLNSKELLVQYETLTIISDGTGSWFVL